MTSRKQRRDRARVWTQTFGTCRNCGEVGARHFAPPGFGSPGMYVCQTKPTEVDEQMPDVDCNPMPKKER